MFRFEKICRIHGKLSINDIFFYTKKGKYYIRMSCKICKHESASRWKKNNPDGIKKQKERARHKEHLRLNQRSRVLIKKYSITLDEYNELLAKQNGVCAICAREETIIDLRYGKVRCLSVDHCHASLKVRALLCQRCNHVIGAIHESPELLFKMIEYLNRHKE